MHFVFLNQYYPPDAAPTGVMLQGLVEELLQGGHEVTVLCASGGYAGARGKTSRHKGPRGSCHARSMGGESLDREGTLEAFPGGSFAGHRQGEVGAGPRGSCHAKTMGGESGDREETLEASAGGSFAEHRPCEAGASRSYDGPAETMGGESLDREGTLEAFAGGSFAEHRPCEAGASRSFEGHAETMGGESGAREGTCEASSGGSFAEHRRCEAGASRSGWRSESPISNLQSPIPPFRVIRIGATRFGRGSFLGKLMDYVSYYVGVAWRLLVMKQRPDRVVALTTPPFLSVVARLVSKLRGGDHAHWVMDLYPDVMTAHGMLGEKGLGFRVLSGLARWGFGGKRCAAVVTLGPDMAERVGRYVDLEVKWVPLWGDGGTGPRGSCHAETMGGESLDREGTLEAFAGGAFAEHRTCEAGASRSFGGPAETMGGESGDREGTLEAIAGGAFAEHRRGEAGVGPRGSCHAETMGGESLDRHGTLEAFAGGSFAEHRRGEAGASRSFGGAAETMGGESGDREGTLEAFAGGSFAEHRPCEAGASRSRIASRSGSSIHDPRSHISSAALRARRGWGDGDLVVMYSGNMGLGHRFGEILAVAERLVNPLSPIPDTLSSSNIRFVFFGGGKRRGEIEEFMRLRPGCGVELHDYVDADWLGVHLGSADVHLVSLDPAWTGMMVPSKLQGIFEVGKPVIFIGSAESSIGTWVKESGAGWVVEPGDVEALEGALEAARDRGLLAEMGRAALEFSRVNFDKRVNLSRVADALVTGRGASIFDGFLPD